MRLHLLPMLLCGLLLAGCQPKTDLRAVTGKVTFHGQPLDQGTIEFLQVQEGKPAVRTAGAQILKGAYNIPGQHGLLPGGYQVTISSPEVAAGPTGVDAMRSPKSANKERIPARFNTESEQFVEVQVEGPSQFDFVVD